MKTDLWVARLNALGRRMDEAAAATHPSAWRELLAADRAAFRQLAARPPAEPRRPARKAP